LTRRGRALLRTIATVLLVGGAWCAATAVRADGATDEPAAAGAPRAAIDAIERGAPLWSPRRAPGFFDHLVAARRLQAVVDETLAPYDACLAVDRPGDDLPLARRAAGQPLTPASTQKLLTSAAALAVFGPEHRFATRAVTAPGVPVDAQGVVAGDLFVVGGGDPMLATPAFEAQLRGRELTVATPVTALTALADAIVDAGVRRVDGALVGDDRRHDDTRFLPVWKESYRTDGEIGALSALAVDHGFSPAGSGQAPPEPAAATVDVLASMLAERGVTIAGGARAGAAPEGTTDVAQVASPQLAEIVGAVLTASDNFAAELLAREVGAAEDGDGSTPAGTAAVVQVLQRAGVDTAGVELQDGSGLAAGNRVTCEALLDVLGLAKRPRFAALDRGLAVAGETGTLVQRFVGDPLQGVLRAKTGYISGVAGLAGIVDDAEHLRFAFLLNGAPSRADGEALQASVARVVAAYPQLDTSVVPPP
jgi:D-alanyl-D-alanine carboxypeptidase/D-alanyl-D-alanine-endopeptidase (penicillin-binding protein 4)